MRHILILEGPYCPIRNIEMHWGTKQLSPFAEPLDTSRSIPFFQEFLLKPKQFMSGIYISGLAANLTPVGPERWEKWTDELFAADRWLKAINEYALKYSQPYRIWITLPYPVEWMYSTSETRIKAVIEWINQFMMRWDENLKKSPLQLSGFVWGRESAHVQDIPVIKGINDWIRHLGLQSLWLPNYSGSHIQDWPSFGFNETAIFSNYTGTGPISRDWLKNACKYALVHGLGIQMIYGTGARFSGNYIEEYKKQIKEYIRANGAGPVIHRSFHLTPLEMKSYLPVIDHIVSLPHSQDTTPKGGGEPSL